MCSKKDNMDGEVLPYYYDAPSQEPSQDKIWNLSLNKSLCTLSLRVKLSPGFK